MLVYELTNDKAFPNHDIAYLPRPCQQCGNHVAVIELRRQVLQ